MVLEKCSKMRRHSLLIGNGLLIFTSLIFLSFYIYFDYQRYLKSYAEAQLLETEKTLKHATTTIENIKKILRLTKHRLTKSTRDITHIQNLLKDFNYFALNHNIPSIQKVSYYKLTFPRQLITRFGTLPLKADFYDSKSRSKEQESVIFYEDTIIGETMILDDQHELVGILEVKMDLANFKELMGKRKTLSFQTFPLTLSQLIQKQPFEIYAKYPLSLTHFFLMNTSTYKIFFIYLCFCFFMMIGVYFFIRKCLNKELEASIKNLKAELDLLKDHEEKTSKELQSHLEENKNYQISCHSLKSFHARLHNRQQQQSLFLERTLTVIKSSLENTNVYLSEKDRLDLLDSSIKISRSLSCYSLETVTIENIEIKKILETIQMFFADKLYKSTISLDITCPQSLFLEGDKFFIQFMLLNVMGRSIYRVPKKSSISIIVSQVENKISFVIQDNGYSLASTWEKLIKKSFNFLIEEDQFIQLCQENKIFYEYLEPTDSPNVTKITFRQFSKEIDHDNVISLFEKTH